MITFFRQIPKSNYFWFKEYKHIKDYDARLVFRNVAI